MRRIIRAHEWDITGASWQSAVLLLGPDHSGHGPPYVVKFEIVDANDNEVVFTLLPDDLRAVLPRVGDFLHAT